MDSAFLERLLTPSPVMHWLLLLLPVTIALSGVLGAAEREPGNRRVAVLAILVAIWLFLPVQLQDPQMAAVGRMISGIGWTLVLTAWARHVWLHRPTPVWVHGLVVTHLVALVIAAGIAVVRALIQG